MDKQNYIIPEGSCEACVDPGFYQAEPELRHGSCPASQPILPPFWRSSPPRSCCRSPTSWRMRAHR